MKRVCAVGVLLVCCGRALGAGDGPVQPDGDPFIQRWDLGPGGLVQLGTPGAPSARLTGQFLPSGDAPEADSHSAAAFLPDGSAVVVANRVSKNLALFNPNTRALVRAIALSGSPQSMAVNPAGTRAVTANLFEGTASIVDLVAGTELTTVAAGPSPSLARITPSGQRAVIASGFIVGQTGDGRLTVIDLSTNAIERTVTIPQPVTGFSINFEAQAWAFNGAPGEIADDNTFVYPDFFNDAVVIVDLSTGASTTIPVGDGPRGVAIYAGGTRAVIAHTGSVNRLTIIDVPARSVLSTINLASQPQGPIAVNGAGTLAAVAILNATVIVNLASGVVSPSLSTATVNQFLTTPDGNSVLAVGFNGSLISFASQSITATLNQFVSTSLGAMAPVGNRAAMFSDTFGEDMVILDMTPGSPLRLSAGPTGPAPEADKTRVVVLNPAGTRAIAVNQFSQTAQVFDTSSGASLAILPTGRRAGAAAVTPDGTKAIVAGRDATTTTVIDLGTLTSTQVSTQNRGDQIRVSPDSQFAYIAHVSPDGVSRINLSNLAAPSTFVATGNMGAVFQGYSSFSGIALSPDGTRLVTCNTVDGTLSVINTATMSVVQTIGSGGTTPIRAVFAPNGSRLYVTNTGSDTIGVFDATGGTLVALPTIATPDAPYDLVIRPDGQRLFVLTTASPSSTVSAFDLPAGTLAGSVVFPTGQSPDALTLSPDGSQVYVVRSSGAYTIGSGGLVITQDGTLASIPTAGPVVATDIAPIGKLSSSIAAAGNVIAVSNLMSEGITLFRTACYANCDGSTTAPVLNALDFACFLDRYRASDPYANCDGSTTAPTLNALDFSCFLTQYRAGCP